MFPDWSQLNLSDMCQIFLVYLSCNPNRFPLISPLGMRSWMDCWHKMQQAHPILMGSKLMSNNFTAETTRDRAATDFKLEAMKSYSSLRFPHLQSIVYTSFPNSWKTCLHLDFLSSSSEV